MGNAESRMGFRKAVFQLYEAKEVSLGDDTFWTQFFAGPASMEELFALVAPRDIRSIITKAPNNMKILVSKAVQIIIKATANGGEGFDRTQILQLSNAVRVLVRVLPFVFEDRGYNWKQELFNQPLAGSSSGKTLAEELVDAIYILLFLPGFTLAPNVTKRKDGTYFIIWMEGIAAKMAPPTTVEIDTCRTEVLKLFLVLMSPVLFMTSSELRANGNSWTNMIIQRAHPNVVMTMLASLLNVVCSYDPIGYGLPYNYVMFTDVREPLVETSLQTLLVLIDYCYPLTIDAPASGLHETVERTANEEISDGDTTNDNDQDLAAPAATTTTPSTNTASQNTNIFQEYVSRIHRREDFVVLTAGLSRLMKSAVESTQTYLPGSRKRVRFTSDLVYFVWKFLELNKRFFAHILRDVALLDIIMPLLYFMNEARNDDGKVGVVHLVAFILLLLSGDRNFGVRLNKAYTQNYPALKLPAIEGNHADVLILCLHRVIVDGHKNLTQLYDCLLTIIANIAPYTKSIGSVTAHKLLSLLRMFTAPKFLLANPTNAELSLILMDALNNMVQYQFDGNTRLVYAILRNQNLFKAIYELNLQTALSKMNVTSASESLDSQKSTLSVGDTSADVATSSATGAQAPVAAGLSPPVSPSLKDSSKPSENGAGSSAEAKNSLEASTKVSIPANVSATNSHTTSSSLPSSSSPRWMPTEEWMFHYKTRMPLLAIMRLLQVLVPQVEQVCKEMNINSEETVLKFLNSGTLVGLLPLPNPIMVRRYKPNASTYVWATVNLWGSIYLANLEPPVWYGTQVALFILRTVD